jgi:hypothetical protein
VQQKVLVEARHRDAPRGQLGSRGVRRRKELNYPSKLAVAAGESQSAQLLKSEICGGQKYSGLSRNREDQALGELRLRIKIRTGQCLRCHARRTSFKFALFGKHKLLAVDTIEPASLWATGQRTHGRLNVDSITSLVELVADLIVVVNGACVDDFDEPSAGVISVRNSFAGRGEGSHQAKSECYKGGLVSERHDCSSIEVINVPQVES